MTGISYDATMDVGNSTNNSSQNSTSALPDVLEKINSATTLTFMVGCIFLIASALRLGFISNFLSRPFTRGYVAGAGCHVFVAQIDKMLGVTVCDTVPNIFKIPIQLYIS